MNRKSFLIYFSLLTFAVVPATAARDLHLTVIQTSDLHSHFTNREDPLGRGGIARVLGKINEIRSTHEHTLLLDAGDWSEGNMFFTLDSGETSQRLLKAMGYDAIVLGNHDWLVGPEALYKAFTEAEMNIPVLSANSDLSQVPPWIKLGDFLRPYIVKEIDGVRVGIFGLSTFELIYDSFYEPARLLDPVKTAAKYVSVLRGKEHCQVVIMLSHLGIDDDKRVATRVAGIDHIAGGHTHILLRQPAYVNGTPITHVGAWGRYVGETDLLFNGKTTRLENYRVHTIDDTVHEDEGMKLLVTGAIAAMEKKFGNIYDDKIIRSDVALPAQSLSTENQLGNWAVDAIREVGDAQMGIDTPFFTSRDLVPGYSSTADIFNVFPHVYNPFTEKAWTIKTFKINGLILKILIKQVNKMGFSLSISNARMVMDGSQGLPRLKSFLIGGRPVNWYREYKIACTEGIYAGIDYFQRKGIDLGIMALQDTGVEAWRAVREKLLSLTPITQEKIVWEGRVRTLQPDLEVRGEETAITPITSQMAQLVVHVRNTGLEPAKESLLNLTADSEVTGPLAGTNLQSLVKPLGPGEEDIVKLTFSTAGAAPGKYGFNVGVAVVPGEFEFRNNAVTTVLDLR